MDDAKVILRNYMRSKKIGRGISDYAAAQGCAEKLGEALAKALGHDFTGVDEDALADVLRTVLRKAYDDSAYVAASVQRLLNTKAGLGIGALIPEFDPEDAAVIAEELAGKLVTAEFVRNLIQEKVIGAVDDTIRRNAEANGDMGLDVHIVRTYSDVGLRAGTKYAEDCQWCLERCGDWDNYADAKAAGCFERHPGCLCIIDYHVGKTHTVSSGNGWSDI